MRAFVEYSVRSDQLGLALERGRRLNEDLRYPVRSATSVLCLKEYLGSIKVCSRGRQARKGIGGVSEGVTTRFSRASPALLLSRL